jgi:hypothetical protein
MKEHELPFDQKVQLLTDGLIAIGIKHKLESTDSIFNYFTFRQDDPYIFKAMRGDLDPVIMNECISLYRLYFPEGR